MIIKNFDTFKTSVEDVYVYSDPVKETRADVVWEFVENGIGKNEYFFDWENGYAIYYDDKDFNRSWTFKIVREAVFENCDTEERLSLSDFNKKCNSKEIDDAGDWEVVEEPVVELVDWSILSDKEECSRLKRIYCDKDCKFFNLCKQSIETIKSDICPDYAIKVAFED